MVCGHYQEPGRNGNQLALTLRDKEIARKTRITRDLERERASMPQHSKGTKLEFNASFHVICTGNDIRRVS